MNAAVQTPQQIQILQRLEYLEQALLAKDPAMKQHLAEIHKLLITYEELVSLLSEEEIGKLMAAQQLHTNVSLVAAVTGKGGKTSASKKAAGIGMDDI